MDGRDFLRNEYISSIKEKIERGELTFEEICKRLKSGVDAELGKPHVQIDWAYLNSCQNLLDSLNNAKLGVSKQPQYQQELIRRIKKNEKPRTLPKWVPTTAFAAMAILVLSILGDNLLYRKWLEGNSSIDMQQYEIAGHVVDPGLVEKGNADPSSEAQEITTQSMEDVIDVLGFTPLVPTWYPDGWEPHTFYASKDANLHWFYEVLVSSTNKNFIMFEVKRFNEIDAAKASFEQDNKGRMLLCNGWNVYITENTNEPVVVWLDGYYCYSLHGPLAEEDLLRIIQSIKKESNQS